MPTDQVDISRTAPGYNRRIHSWRKIRAALEGEDAVKAQTDVYLPKPTGMKVAAFRNYLARAMFYPVASRTLRGLVGMVFRRDPKVELPARMEPMKLSMTSEGFTAEQALRENVRESMSLGRFGLLVDMPQQASATALPYVATYKAEDILNWSVRVNPETGRRETERVVVREEPETLNIDTDAFVLRELVLLPEPMVLDGTELPAGTYVQRVYAKRLTRPASNQFAHGEHPIGDSGSGTTTSNQTRSRHATVSDATGGYELIEAFVPTMAGESLSEIPFWFVNVMDLRPIPDKAPFEDMTSVSYAHYRNSADYEQGLHMIAAPTPYVFGIDSKDVPKSVGPSTIWSANATDVTVGLLEYTGSGVGSIREAMQDKEENMAALGARLIRDQERANVTAQTTRLQSKAEESTLVVVVRTVSEAWTLALKFAARWIGANPEDVEVELNTDFVELEMPPQQLIALVGGWQSGAYSRETLHQNLQRGEVIPADRTLADEIALQEAEAETMVPAAPGSTLPPGGDEFETEDEDEEAEEAEESEGE